jgi:hypothetical protein
MHIVYWAHSYRTPDAQVNAHFGRLIEDAKLIANLDPPSNDVNASKLEQNLRVCDGMVVVLPWRDSGPAPYILYEIGLALRARKPVLVFLDDRLSDGTIPASVLQRRFSHGTYFRQLREHVHALHELRTYMGDHPGPKYQPSGQKTCGFVGLSATERPNRELLRRFVSGRGYRLVDLERIRIDNPLQFKGSEELADLDVAIHCVDSRSRRSEYWTGVLNAAAIPAIPFTLDVNHALHPNIPREFQPRIAGPGSAETLQSVMTSQFELFEQNFISVKDPEAIERYTQMQLEAGVLGGRYEPQTRHQFTEVIMGDKNIVSGGQVGAIGSQAHAHDMTFNQIWNQVSNTIDLSKLAEQLGRLQQEMEVSSTEPEHKLAAGAVAAAKLSAEKQDGPKVVQYLKSAGKWTLGVAEKLGLEIAKEALKGALGMK